MNYVETFIYTAIFPILNICTLHCLLKILAKLSEGYHMKFPFFNSVIWQLVKQMDLIAILILLGLLILSILCIAIIALKYSLFKKHQQLLKEFAQRLRHAKTVSEITSISKEYKDTLGGKVIITGLQEMRLLLDKNMKRKTPSDSSLEKEADLFLTTQDLSVIEETSERCIEEVVYNEETYLPILGTSAATAPLVGLFGTIWGLIHAFVDISQEKSADIATVAPGMAEALIVTLAGLIVAIPALIAFHYFSNEVKKITALLYQAHDRFLSVVRQTLIK